MILSDREVEAALDQKRIIIEPRPDPAYMDSTALDLRLDGTLDRWEFPPPNAGLGQKVYRFCPGVPNFRFADIEKEFAKPVEITGDGYELPPSFQSTPETGPRHFILGWTIERIVLNPDRDVLRERIARRFVSMLEQGASDEVAALLARGLDPSLPAMKAIGVREIADWLSGETTRGEMIERAVIATRQYAKRQRTWFRGRMADWSWIGA